MIPDTFYDVKISKSMIDTVNLEGKLEGKLEEKIEIILSSFDDGLDITRITRITKLSEVEVDRVLKEHGKEYLYGRENTLVPIFSNSCINITP